MRARFSVAALATLALLVAQVAVWGQSSTSTLSFGGTSGSSSGMGTSSMGSSSGTFGNRSMGSSLTPGNRSFTGGSSGMGTGMGNSGTPGAGNTTVGQTQNATQFMNNAYRQGFVGASSNNMANILGGVTASQNNRTQNSRLGTMGLGSSYGMQGLGRMGMNQFGNNRLGQGLLGNNMMNMMGGAASTQPPLALQAAFDYPKPPSDKLTTALTRRLVQTKGLHMQSPVTVLAQNGTVTLRGTVASEHARAVAERLVRLEPGVWKVNNELQVAGAPADSTPPKSSAGATAAPGPAR